MIEFRNIQKKFPNGKVAVDNISMKFDKGEFICFIGTSGSGKTTCMRMINRMIDATEGELLIDGQDVKQIDEVALRRRIGYVIQKIGLMPHMTIFDNIVMVPRLLKWDEKKLRPLAEKLIKKVDLPVSFLERYPSELSGGQQQRIGVIRALAADQDIILMDEPFGALDPLTRDSLQKLVKHLQHEMGKTVVFVTHDMDEALKLADKIAILDEGKLIQFDTVQNILLNPANDFVRNLIGEERLIEAQFDFDTVEKIMMKEPVKVNIDTDFPSMINLMHKRRVDTLFVVDDDNTLLGLVDIFDLRRKSHSNDIHSLIKPVDTLSVRTKIKDAIYYINNLEYRNVPVVDDNQKLVGLITRAVIVDCLCENFWRDYLPEDEEAVEKINSTNTAQITES